MKSTTFAAPRPACPPVEGHPHRARAFWRPGVVLAGFRRLQDRATQRHRLRDMESWQLRDLGLSRAAAQRESRRPFWVSGKGA